MGERLLKLKAALQQTVTDPDCVKENYKDGANDVEQSNAETKTRQNKGGTAKKLVMSDDGFWPRVQQHVDVTLPIMKFLRRHDTTAPSVGKVYSGWFELSQHLRSYDTPYQEQTMVKHEQRWLYGDEPFFHAAYVLDPEFISHNQSSLEEVMSGFMTVLERFGILFEVRHRYAEDPKKYQELWDARAKRIAADPSSQQTWEGFPSYPDEKDSAVKAFCARAHSQLSLYCGRKGIFSLGSG